jgi:AcrR family transcriptional regulator
VSDSSAARSLTNMQRRLLDAAEVVFHEKGYQRARVSDIVGNAGVAQGSFYLHFRNKKAIFLELIDGFFAHLMAETLDRYPVTAIENQDDLRCQLEGIWSILIKFCRDHPELTRLILDAQSSLPPEDRVRLSAHFDRIAGALALYMRHTIAAGLVRPLNPDLVGWVVLGMIERALHFAVFVLPQSDSRSLARDLTEFELNGLLSRTSLKEACDD